MSNEDKPYFQNEHYNVIVAEVEQPGLPEKVRAFQVIHRDSGIIELVTIKAGEAVAHAYNSAETIIKVRSLNMTVPFSRPRKS